jgi:hypothetical protein
VGDVDPVAVAEGEEVEVVDPLGDGDVIDLPGVEGIGGLVAIDGGVDAGDGEEGGGDGAGALDGVGEEVPAGGVEGDLEAGHEGVEALAEDGSGGVVVVGVEGGGEQLPGGGVGCQEVEAEPVLLARGDVGADVGKADGGAAEVWGVGGAGEAVGLADDGGPGRG